MSHTEAVGTVEGAGVSLAYRERGDGRAVLLIHGIGDDARAWETLIPVLAARARAIAYDRRGYGGSGAPDPYTRTTVNEQTEDAAALLRRLGAGPAVACGRDLGALVCLDLLERHPSLLAGAVAIDPPLYAFAPSATEALAAERDLLEETLRTEGAAAAVEKYLATAGADSFRIARATAAPLAFFADYAGLATWPVTRARLRALAAPLIVLTTTVAPVHAVQAADALANLVPRVRRVIGDDPATAVLQLLEDSG